MSYENAPSTKLVATHCAACARPLVDAVSVETGMGPDCRKKHGYAHPDVAADAMGVAISLATSLPGDVYVEMTERLNDAFRDGKREADLARVAANVLVYRIAIEQTGPLASAYVTALEKLGFTRLAARIGERLGQVTVTEEGGMLVIATPYNPSFVSLVRGLPGRRFDREREVNLVPRRDRARVWGFLKTTFPAGTLVRGPKGTVAL